MLKACFDTSIGRSAADVYELLPNHENDVRWQSVVASVTRLTPGPVRPGSRFRHTLTLLGARMDCEVEVADTRHSQFRAFSIVGGPFAFETRIVLSESGAGTAVQTEIVGHSNGISRLAITLSKVRSRAIEQDLRVLKQMMESGAL